MRKPELPPARICRVCHKIWLCIMRWLEPKRGVVARFGVFEGALISIHHSTPFKQRLQSGIPATIRFSMRSRRAVLGKCLRSAAYADFSVILMMMVRMIKI